MLQFYKNNILLIGVLWLVLGCKTRYYPLYEHNEKLAVTIANTDSAVVQYKHSNKKSTIETYLCPLHNDLEKIMNEKLGVATDVFKKDKIENALGYLITDAMLERGKLLSTSTKIYAIYNYGGIRASQLSKGTITLGQIFEVLPFENTLAIVTINGSTLKKWCALIAQKGGWPISGFTFASNKEVATQLDFIRDNDTYTILTNDYIAAGNDGCDFLKNNTYTTTTTTIRDVVIEYIKNKKNITPDNTPRITIEKN